MKNYFDVTQSDAPYYIAAAVTVGSFVASGVLIVTAFKATKK